MRTLFLALSLCALADSAFASHGTRQIGAPLTTAEAAMSSMYANPPLPMTAFKAGDHKLSVMLDYFGVQKPAGDGDSHSPSDVSRGNGLQGFGGAVLYDHALFDWGSVYGLFMGARLGAGRLNGKSSENFWASPANRADTIFQAGESHGSTSLAFSIGANARLIGDSPDGFTLGTFIGPIVYLTHGSGWAAFLNNTTAGNSSNCGEAIAGYNCVQRNYVGDATTFGVLAGVQANIPIGKSFAVNPFLLALPSTAFEHQDDLLKSDHVKLDQPITVGTNSGVQATTSQTDYVRAIPPVSFGLNVAYRPWSLTANLTGSLFTAVTNRMLELKGNKILKLQFSKSFGNFPR